MLTQELFVRIVVNPKMMFGKPIIGGIRLTVKFILNRLGRGATVEDCCENIHG